jgi:hypothetical protein
VIGRMLAQGIYWGTRSFERIEQEAARYLGHGRVPKLTRPKWLRLSN